jgi:hypothetical protein
MEDSRLFDDWGGLKILPPISIDRFFLEID